MISMVRSDMQIGGGRHSPKPPLRFTEARGSGEIRGPLRSAAER